MTVGLLLDEAEVLCHKLIKVELERKCLILGLFHLVIARDLVAHSLNMVYRIMRTRVQPFVKLLMQAQNIILDILDMLIKNIKRHLNYGILQSFQITDLPIKVP